VPASQSTDDDFLVVHRCNEKADIFSYGIVLWEIITQETPQRGTLRDIKVDDPAAFLIWPLLG